MKKIITLVLVLVMAVSLFACASNTPAPAASTEPADSPEPSTTSAVVDTSTVSDLTGYPGDPVDNFARDKYKFAFMYSSATSISAMFYNAMKDFEDKMNFEIMDSSSDGDNELFINNMETFAVQGFDGFLLNPDTNIMERVCEVCKDELQIPFILVFNAYLDEEGRSLYPCVNLFAQDLGRDCMNWMLDNYKTYLGDDVDVATSNIGFGFVTHSVIPDLALRTTTAIDVLHERLGEDVPVFVADCVNTSVSEQGGYEALAPLLAAHPEYEYWIIFADMPDFANGAARAVEQAGKDDKTLMTCGGETLLIKMWEENDYDGCWVGAYAINNYLYVLPMLNGLIALRDGRATYDTLWADTRRPGDFATLYSLPTRMYTKDNYVDIMHEVEDELGFEIAWY
ncbi:MAG: substrate-binding domain-containing protein [Oscillospiraceae bacterium]|nr:substrate-binding domain-containing protein [Oscillospiraceae bacterium]